MLIWSEKFHRLSPLPFDLHWELSELQTALRITTNAAVMCMCFADETCHLLQGWTVKSLICPLLKPADRDIPKRAEVQSAPRLSSHEKTSYLWLLCVYNPLVYCHGISMSVSGAKFSRKNHVTSGSSESSLRTRQWVTQTRRRNLKLTEGSDQTVSTTRRGGSEQGYK